MLKVEHPSARNSFSFEKEKRLITSHDFKRVFDHGCAIKTRYFVMLCCYNDVTIPRLGLVISKKNIPTAVKRNQVKRIIREYFRLNKPPKADYVVIAKARINDVYRDEMWQQLEYLWSKLT